MRSLLKSVTGLQARKLQELQIPNFASEPPDSLELRSSAGFRAGLMSLLKGRKGPLGGGRLRLAGGAAAGGLEGLPAGGDDPEAMLNEGGGDDLGAGSSGGGSADYLELMRSAMRVKHKQRKMLLLLGTVPPLPAPAGHPFVATAGVPPPSATAAIG